MTPSQKKWTAAAVVLGIAIVMFATNPDQAAHLRTMKETVELKPHDPSMVPTAFFTATTYNNYFLFSTTTMLDHVTSWGAFGKVSTTDRIFDPFGLRDSK